MSKPAFTPDGKFEVLDGRKPFNDKESFEVLDGKPTFDPKKSFESIAESLLRKYVKTQKPLSTLDEEDVLGIIRGELAKNKSKPDKIIERIVEKRIEVQRETKDEKKEVKEIKEVKEYIEKEKFEVLQKEIVALKENIQNMIPLLSMSGGSGVVGLPGQEHKSGKFLTTNGNQANWADLAGGAGSDPFYIGDPDVDGSWRFIIDGSDLNVERRESSVWNEKAAFTA